MWYNADFLNVTLTIRNFKQTSFTKDIIRLISKIFFKSFIINPKWQNGLHISQIRDMHVRVFVMR